MQTEHQMRLQQISDIILFAEISDDRTLCQQLESMSCLGINVVHQIVTKMATKEEQVDSSFERRY